MTMKHVWLLFAVQFVLVVCDIDPLLLRLLDRVKVLEREGAMQKRRILELEDEVRQLKDIYFQETDEVKDIQKDTQGETSVRSHPKRSRRMILDTEVVAFHASLDGPKYTHNHVGMTLTFDDLKTNIGGAYNNSTGIFIAPIHGIYLFSVSVMAPSHGDAQGVMVDIMKNGVEIGAAFAEGVGNMDQGSISVVTELLIGDEVHVSITRREDTELWGDKLTSFMGCLVTTL